MRYVVVTMFDSAAQVYSQPQYVASLGGFQRSFADEVNTPRDGNQLHRHPGDFHLYELGFFDDNSGVHELHDKPRLVSRAVDLVKSD